MHAQDFIPQEPVWIYPKHASHVKQKIITEFKIHPVMAQILIARGVYTKEEIHNFLYSKLPDLHDPFLLAQMPAAVARICHARKNNEGIVIYGDNDVDGMTGTALLTEFLQLIGCRVLFYVAKPGTMRQQLIIEALEYALNNSCSLLITVDCGITSATEIAQLKEHGVDVIITDHHEPTHTIPHCIATLNPKLLDNPYPNRDLTGVGVAFKLAHALTNRLTAEGALEVGQVDLKRFLDLVALGTVADTGTLLGENRILVSYGLEQLRKTERIGLMKLFYVCEVDPQTISPFTIVSKIAPRLNSLGRIADPQKGVELLLLRDSCAAEQLALELDLNNLARQKIEKTMTLEVEKQLDTHPEMLQHKALVLSSTLWHPGVIAILSTRYAKQYNRPCIMIAIDQGIGKGSLRSISEFPLLPILKECSSLLINFGGHDFAAGLTVKEENIEAFRSRFIDLADATLTDSDVVTKLYLDAEVNFEELTFDLIESIGLLEPFGTDNHPPILYTKAKLAWTPKIVGRNHLKLILQQGDRLLEGIAFNKADQLESLRRKELTLEIAFTLQVNHYQGPTIQLLIRDMRICE